MLTFILIFLSLLTCAEINYEEVKLDILDVLRSGGDYGNHGPRIIRLAWHCAGTYRTTDGRGGCDGAHIRFDPELNWADNAGQDGALKLLEPIKLKYGSELSWGDLIVLAANTAISGDGEGPEIEFCAGRVDAVDGSESKHLDIGSIASEIFLIYVNPEVDGATQIREVFGKMDMNDRETVALIGGGHAFGQCHTSRSGFEGPWTTNPILFDNEYFKLLKDHVNEYTLTELENGQHQYEKLHNDVHLMMLKTDIALTEDEDYKKIVEEYADDFDTYSEMFAHSWTKLVNRDFGNKPCAQDTVEIPDEIKFYNQSYWNEVKDAVRQVYNVDTSQGPFLVRLAWHCAGTYRDTDHRGGCDGARIRHNPEKEWPDNAGLQDALGLIEPIYDQFHDSHGLSWADLIIIAGTTALEDMGALEMEFCPGRTDQNAAEAVEGSKYLEKTIYLDGEHGREGDTREMNDQMKDSMGIMGFTLREMTVLNGGGHTIGQCHKDFSGFDGKWVTYNDTFDNEYFKTLLNHEHEWTLKDVEETGRTQFETTDGDLMMLHTDLVFLNDPEFRAIVQEYAGNNDLFLTEFRDAWIKLVNADRYGDVCLQVPESKCTFVRATVCPENPSDLPDCMYNMGTDALCKATDPIPGFDEDALNTPNCPGRTNVFACVKCVYVEATEEECPDNPTSLQNCHIHRDSMENGEICEATETLPDGNTNFEINNCAHEKKNFNVWKCVDSNIDYQWQSTGFSDCSTTCDTGFKEEGFACEDREGKVVADGLCLDEKPVNTLPCNVQNCEPPQGYEHLPKSCVSVDGSSILTYEGKTVTDCAEICETYTNCYGFNFGVDYGGVVNKAGDCTPMTSADYSDCNGESVNLDFYKRVEGAKSEATEVSETDNTVEVAVVIVLAILLVISWGACAYLVVNSVPDEPTGYQKLSGSGSVNMN